MTEEKTETETKPDPALTAEAKRAQSIKTNLHDEQSIKVLNANFTVKASAVPDGDAEKEQEHLGLMAEALIEMIVGIDNHISTDLVVAREKMRSVFTDTAIIRDKDGKITNAREILLSVAACGRSEVKTIFKDTKWTEKQLSYLDLFVLEQLPFSIMEKAKKTPKAILTSPITVPKKALEKLGVIKGKNKL